MACEKVKNRNTARAVLVRASLRGRRMGDLFWNKIIGAVLATALAIFGIRELGHALIHSPEPAVPGYKIAVAEDSGSKQKEPEVREVVSLAQLLSTASVAGGERVVKKCAACHDFTKGGRNKIGPNLWNVLGSQSASHEGFSYSQAMRDFGGVWDYANLDAFLTSPKALVPGTAMGFAGLKNASDTANLLVYLRSLSDAPLPLPALAATGGKTDDEAEEHDGVVEEKKSE